MTDTERREAARQFYNKWHGRGKEDEDDRSFWIDFLQDVLGIDHVTDRIEFQKKVVGKDGHTKRIDAYIPETRVLIEQKSLGIDLSKPQSGHDGMTPYEQARYYNECTPYSEKAKWIIVSNFAEIWIYDMDARIPEPQKIMLAEIPTKFSLFEFLVNKEQKQVSKEMEISVKAGGFVGLLYDALLKQYLDPENEESLKSLNMLCVRLVFCLYAEDAHIFGTSGHMFHDYLDQFATKDMRKALIELFKILDTPEEKRDPYDTSDLSKFPYVNGGLFAKEDIEIPNFTEEIRDILLAKASEGFDWSMISPTIFGAVFESTLNPETRRSGGMHYTSIENIHKVIDPLFLDDLKAEYQEIETEKIERTKRNRLKEFQDKLAGLTWLDPACGSGNFLTETYVSIRRLENQVIRSIMNCDKDQVDGQIAFTDINVAKNPIKVSIDQFYGIEINDFAVTVAKTALWIAESQMMKETEDIIRIDLDFLPLTTNAYIVEGNALRMDWNDVIPANRLNYIMGNPPFLGARIMNNKQKEDMIYVFGKDWNGVGNLDYVSCWYKKCADIIKSTNIRTALVSTNSVTQGEQVAILWEELFKSIHFDFAYKTFIWDSEATQKAHVHCVIIGFSNSDHGKKYIYDGVNKKEVKNINGYLLDGENIFVESNKTPICKNAPIARSGNQPIDNGNYIFTEEEYENFIQIEPSAKKYFKRWYGAEEFINKKTRYCLWLGDCEPNALRKMPKCLELVNRVKEYRLSSKRKGTVNLANKPTRFQVETMPQSEYLIMPLTSSERRRYVPIGFMTPDSLASNLVTVVENANKYHFGVLTSNVFMAWMRAVGGRLKSDYRITKDNLYNVFPWPTPTEEQKQKIEQTAQNILDARALYPESSLADLYDPLTMPPELQKAHAANDRAVMQAYGFNVKNTSEADCVAALMKMYQELTAKEK